MVRVSGGTYTPGDRRDSVTVHSFCIDATEVTVSAYTECAGTGQCSAEHLREWSADGTNFSPDPACNYGMSNRGRHPINCVDWGQSATYCHAKGKRLPTEEEWEWAARGGVEGRKYPWGDAEPEVQTCWSGVTKRTGTCPVGSFPEGDAPGQIHDLAGNVWEWTVSSFDAGARVCRGGSWSDDVTSNLRADLRDSNAPSNRLADLGFRCAR